MTIFSIEIVIFALCKAIKKSASILLHFYRPEKYLVDVQKLKEEMAERFQSKASLNSPPHITLHMPFKFPERKEEVFWRH